MSDEVLFLLRSDPAACDVHVALFVSAANSYRFDSVLSPFPPTLCKIGNHGEKDIDSLVRIPNFFHVPSLLTKVLFTMLFFRGKLSHLSHRSG